MFPDNNHYIPCPKFFAITLTNQQDIHSYLYCLKFNEKYSFTKEKEEKKMKKKKLEKKKKKNMKLMYH